MISSVNISHDTKRIAIFYDVHNACPTHILTLNKRFIIFIYIIKETNQLIS